MRIIVLNTVPNLTDVNVNLASALARQGVGVTLIGTALEQVDNLPLVTVRSAGGSRGRTNIFSHVSRIWRIMSCAREQEAADSLYHVPDSVSAAAAVCQGLGRRTVWHGHSNVYHHVQDGNPWAPAMYYLMRFSTALSARHVARLITFGKRLLPWWERSGFNRHRIAIIPNAAPEVTTSGATLPSIAHSWNQRRFKLLYVGRLADDKGGHIELLEAVHRLSRRTLPVSLLIFGRGPAEKRLQRYVQDKGMSELVSFGGQQSRGVVQAAYRAADLVVLPSKGEMMPRVMLEAWAAGAPFMATAVGAIPDYLVDGVNGYLLASKEPVYLAERIATALAEGEARRRIAAAGRVTAQSLTWEQIIGRFIELYAGLLQENACQADA